MKKLLLILPIIVLLGACGGNSSKSQNIAHDLIENPNAFKGK